MSWNLRPGPDGKQRSYNPQGPYQPKKRFPVPMPLFGHKARNSIQQRHGNYPERNNYQSINADIIYERFNKTDMLKEMRNDCPAFSNNRYNQNSTPKPALIEYWMKHGNPGRTVEFQRRSRQHEGRFKYHQDYYEYDKEKLSEQKGHIGWQ